MLNENSVMKLVSWSLTSLSAHIWLYQRWKVRVGEPSLPSKRRQKEHAYL